ncbi:hypothetical protein KDL29_12150 [bacterium]|nr:hypothetical protein [bacterium]
MLSIILKEYRQRARGIATLGLIMTYTIILGGVSFFVYLARYTELQTRASTSSQVGLALCITTFIAQMIMSLLLALSLNASTIAHEKDQDTFELLNLTLFKSFEIVLGKYLSSTGFLFLLVITAMPIYALAFTFGGLTTLQFMQLAVVVVGMTLMISALGLMLSLISDDVRTALGRSFFFLITLGAVTLIFGGIMKGALSSTPPVVPIYWLGVFSFLMNPLFSAMEIFNPSVFTWSQGPVTMPFLMNNGLLWIWSALLQTVIAALILLATTVIYPRYRASKAGGVG